LVDSLPHLVKRGVVAATSLQINQNVPISGRIAGAFHGRVGRDRRCGEVRLVQGGRHRHICLVVRDFNRWNAVWERSVRRVAEKWLDRLRQIATVDRRRGGSVHGQAGQSRVHSMMKDRCRRKNVCEKRVVAAYCNADLLISLSIGTVRDEEQWAVVALAANLRTAERSCSRDQQQPFG